MSSRRRLLIVDPDPVRGMELYAAMRDLKAEADLVQNAEVGWRRFAETRPDAVILSFAPQGKGGDVFMRRLRNEYMGVLPPTFLLCTSGELAQAALLEPDAFLVPPVARSALSAIVSGIGTLREETSVATRLREMFDLSLLGGDIVRGLDALVTRGALAFQTDCAAWAWGDAPDTWPRTSRELDTAERAALFERVKLASQAAGTVLFGSATGRGAVTDAVGQSVLALPLVSGELVLGGVAMVGDGTRLYSAGERDVLVLLARRMTNEMAWVSAHARMLSENEKLREAALVDSLTGVWNRQALEQAVAAQIQATARTPQALTLLVVDVVKLATINDRYGHRVGDAVLAHLAGLIAANMRAQDVVGRIGGDEFAVLLVGADAEGARSAVDHLRAAIAAAPYRHGGEAVQFAARFSISEIRPGEQGATPALNRAQGGLGRARRSSMDGMEITDASPVDATGASGDSIPPGTTIGGMYRVLHEISRGAMGVVYRGEDLGLGRQVALKMLRSDLAQDEGLVARFRAEAALLASLHHPNMVQIYTLGTERDMAYFVMELVEGESVADVMVRHEFTGSPIELSQVAKVMDEVGSALEGIHALGIVHRDVKPDNILMDRVHDRAVLVDVGVAKRAGGAREAAGTPGYAAPESFMDRDPSPMTDVYGLAATAYAMLTGLPPFGAGDLLPVFERQVHERPAPPSLLRPGISFAVDEALMRGLHPDPESRFRSAASFAFALCRAIEQSQEAAGPAGQLAGSGVANMAAVPERDDDTAHTQRYRGVRIDEHGVVRGPLEVRGIFFRAGYQLCGRQYGTSWIARLAESDPDLAKLVRLSTGTMGWHPAPALVAVCGANAIDDNAQLDVARLVGDSALTLGFSQMVTLPPGAELKTLLDDSATTFARFFRGSNLTVEELDEASCAVSVGPCPGSRTACAVIEGWLMRLAELAGGTSVTIEHPDHLDGGEGPCHFQLRWS